MTIHFPTLAIALAVLVSAPVAAQTQSPPGEQATTKSQRADRAKERCRLNHGVDCDTPEGLKEWLLLERSREEAVRDGSRHPLPMQPRPAPSRR
jgi:aminoglycoside phosphotransferase (APT) family kinase protein